MCVGVAVCIAAAALSCKPMGPPQGGKTPKAPAGKPSDGSPAAEAPKAAVPHVIDVGDVEAGTKFTAVLDGKSKAPNVTEEELTDVRGDLDMVTLKVMPPYPKELWVSFRVNAKGSFGDTPVALRAKILREKDTIGTMAFVFGAPNTPVPYTYSVDVLSGLASPPKSLLVYALGDVILCTAGTDPKTIDPKTVAGLDQNTGAVQSNPVRINFVAGEGTP